MRILIETLDTVREFNSWEIADVVAVIPDWAELSEAQRRERVAELIGEGAEYCKNLEADTLEREVIAIEADLESDGENP